jgi:hypothetical protein
MCPDKIVSRVEAHERYTVAQGILRQTRREIPELETKLVLAQKLRQTALAEYHRMQHIGAGRCQAYITSGGSLYSSTPCTAMAKEASPFCGRHKKYAASAADIVRADVPECSSST